MQTMWSELHTVVALPNQGDDFPISFTDQCGVSLSLRTYTDFNVNKGPGWVTGFEQFLVDNQLEVKNLTNTINLNKAAAAQRDEQLRKNAEQQKSPF
jgi:hypothetical protein